MAASRYRPAKHDGPAEPETAAPRSFVRPACVVCGKRCIPLADWDQPVCIGCDDTYALAVERSRFDLPATTAQARKRPPAADGVFRRLREEADTRAWAS